MDLGDALAWLDSHQNLERMLADKRVVPPDLSRMTQLMDAMGDPQFTSAVLHVTGTNGKTSTSRALGHLLGAKGLSVGVFTSPHLQRINERIAVGDEPIADEDLAAVLSSLADLEALPAQARLTWFELVTAAAFGWFADRPVDAVVAEVGMGGRWDATNVVHAAVSVVTNVGLDHVEFLGDKLSDIAREKAGITEAGGALVLGETDPDLVRVFEAEQPELLWLRNRDFSCIRNDLAVGGRVVDLRTPGGSYDDIFVNLHGRHQADNFVLALTAAEAFFGAPLEADIVEEAAGSLRSPGRFEVVRRRPLVVLDGAKNLEGARTLALAVDEEFSQIERRILVVGMLKGKDPVAMLEALDASRADLVVACLPPSPRAQAAEDVAAAAESLGLRAVVGGDVEESVAVALAAAGEDDLVLVTGSLYVVGAARTALLARSRT